MAKSYRVETLLPNVNKWHFLQGSYGNRSFARGVVFGLYHAVQAERPATRIVCVDDGSVLEEYPAKNNTPGIKNFRKGRS